MFSELKEERELLAMHQELNRLKVEVRTAEKWIDYAKDTIETLQTQIYAMEERNVSLL